MTEEVRLSAHITGRRCACRGWIVAPDFPGKAAAERVAEHQMTAQHRSFDWDEWREANTATVDIPVAKLRKVG